jgi:hypothetical protein
MILCHRLLFPLAALITSAAAAWGGDSGPNLVGDPGFEGAGPVVAEQAWQVESGAVFATIERQTAVVHGGRQALHLVDDLRNEANHVLSWQLPVARAHELRGRRLLFRGWVRQVRASTGRPVGLGLWCNGDDGQTVFRTATVEVANETPWAPYQVSLMVPPDVRLVRACLLCGNGFNQTGEAYFDDLELLAEDVRDPAPAPPDQASARLWIYRDAVLDTWNRRTWGGLSAEESEAAASGDGVGIRLRSKGGTQPWAGLAFAGIAINRRSELAGFAPGESWLEYRLRAPSLPRHQARIGKGPGVEPTAAELSSGADGWTQVRVPFGRLAGTGAGTVDEVMFQFCEAIPDGQLIEIDQICLASRSPGAQVRIAEDDPPEVQELARLTGVYPEDGRKRPDIKAGTFDLDGRPVFFTGVCYEGELAAIDWGPGSERPGLEDPVYQEPYSRQMADRMGMNSVSFASTAIVAIKERQPYGRREVDDLRANRDVLKRLDGMPFLLDLSLFTRGKIVPAEVEQQNPDWHQFLPWCPEHPEGKRRYLQNATARVAYALEHGGNPFVHELFNEPAYNCMCAANRQSFARLMHERYRTIAAANQKWGSAFASFEEAAALPVLQRCPGLWADWCVFSGDRYADLLREVRAAILAVDRRSQVRFTEQMVVGSLLKFRGAGMDYRKVAEVVDILGTESGRDFGNKAAARGGRGNAAEEAAATSGELYSFLMDLYTALGRGVKPVMNNEYYCARFHLGRRVPSRKADFTTALWNDVMHGGSGTYFYSWMKRTWEWKTLEEAGRIGHEGGWEAYCLGNPASYPRESLDGVRQFQRELEPLAELALPMPRLGRASVALVFSYPSLRMSPISTVDFERRIKAFYSGLLYANYPVEVLFEEDLPTANLARFDALVFPFIRNCYPGTPAAVRAFVEGGGTVLCASDSFACDEYERRLASEELLGARLSPCAEIVETIDCGEVAVRLTCRQQAACTSAKPFLSGAAGAACVTVNRIGKGSLYLIAGEVASASDFRALAERAFGAGVRRHARLVTEDGAALVAGEVQVIDRGERKLACVINWEDRGTRLARLSLRWEAGDGAYCLDPLTGALRLAPSGAERWSAGELERGVLLQVPAQERVLLLFSAAPPEATRRTAEADVRTAAEAALRSEVALRAAEDGERAQMQRAYDQARAYEAPAEERCEPVDLSRHVNMGFRDETEGDRVGGWFDQGGNDFRNMPLGGQRLANIPFRIIDPAANGGRSAIILAGQDKPWFPAQVEGIPVGGLAANVYFLHGFGWDGPADTPSHTYLVHYQDGTTVEAPAVIGQSIAGWWNPRALPDARIACESANLISGNIGLYCWRWRNPHPDRPIRCIDLVSARTVVPAIVAITVERP